MPKKWKVWEIFWNAPKKNLSAFRQLFFFACKTRFPTGKNSFQSTDTEVRDLIITINMSKLWAKQVFNWLLQPGSPCLLPLCAFPVRRSIRSRADPMPPLFPPLLEQIPQSHRDVDTWRACLSLPHELLLPQWRLFLVDEMLRKCLRKSHPTPHCVPFSMEQQWLRPAVFHLIYLVQ